MFKVAPALPSVVRRALLRASRYIAGSSLFVLPLASSACVRASVHEETVERLQAARAEATQRGARADALSTEAEKLRNEVARLEQENRARTARIEEVSVQRSNEARKIDELVQVNEELSQRLFAAGQSVTAFVKDRDATARDLAETKARLEKIGLMLATAQLRELGARLRAWIDAGALEVVMRDCRVQIELSADVLFEADEDALTKRGQKIANDVSRVLEQRADHRFSIAAHTDTTKIRTARFQSSEALSVARAFAVQKLLVDKGVARERLSASGYGEGAPLAKNDTKEGRAKNRRIEIVLIPDAAASCAPAPTSPP